MGNYREQREWSDKFIPKIKQIVGQYLLVQSNFEDDTQHACDLIILKARDMRIAARIRKYFYYEKYPYEFTIRSKTKTDLRTEIHKILEGWGDWMFYGFTDKNESDILAWSLLDLSVLRYHHKKCKEIVITGEKNNFDGTGFRWFDIRSFNNNFVIASTIFGANHD